MFIVVVMGSGLYGLTQTTKCKRDNSEHACSTYSICDVTTSPPIQRAERKRTKSAAYLAKRPVIPKFVAALRRICFETAQAVKTGHNSGAGYGEQSSGTVELSLGGQTSKKDESEKA